MRPSGGRIDARERRDERARMSLADACLGTDARGLRPWASRIVVRAGGCDCGRPGVIVAPGNHPLLAETTERTRHVARKTIEMRLAEIDAQRKTLQARLSKQERAHDTRRKVLLGALVLHRLEASKDEEFSRRLGDWLRRELPGFLTRDGDKDLFADLLKPPPVRSKPIEDATLEDTEMRDALTNSSRIATNPGEL